MTLVGHDCEIVPGVRLRRAPGHNRDMAVVTVASRGETFCFLSDLVPTAAHLQPTWVAAFDLYPLQTIENKQQLLAEAADGNWVCGFAHDVQQPFARITRDEKRHFSLASHDPALL